MKFIFQALRTLLLASLFVMLSVFLYIRAAASFGCAADSERTACLSFLGCGCCIWSAAPHNGSLSYLCGFMLWTSHPDVRRICCSDCDSYIYWIYFD